jgi:hypothetical protein
MLRARGRLSGAGYPRTAPLARAASVYPAPVGPGAVGATVTMHGALLLGKDLRRDALYSAAGLAVLLALSLAAVLPLIGVDDLRHGFFALLLVALLTATHTLFDATRDGLDAAFFPPVVRQERAAARAYTTGPGGAAGRPAPRSGHAQGLRRRRAPRADPPLRPDQALHLPAAAPGGGGARGGRSALRRAELREGRRAPPAPRHTQRFRRDQQQRTAGRRRGCDAGRTGARYQFAPI